MGDERHIPTLFRKPLAEGRLLVVSPVSQSIRRVDARSAAQRNRYILDHADSLFLGARDPDGSLTDLFPLPSHLYSRSCKTQLQQTAARRQRMPELRRIA